MFNKQAVLLSSLCFFSVILCAQEYKIEVSSTSKTGIVKVGEEFTVDALVKVNGKDAKASDGLILVAERWTDGVGHAKAETEANSRYSVTTRMDRPGWAYFILQLKNRETGKVICDAKKRPLRWGIGVIADPEKLKTVRKEPAGFDAFWDKAKKELASVPMRVLEKKTVKPDAKYVKEFELYDIKLSCCGPKPVSGYLTVPADKTKKYPAVLQLHGAGVRSANKAYRSGMIVLNINAHGIPNGQPAKYYTDLNNGELKGYSTWNKADRDKIYFRYMYLRVLRALEYLKSLPEWNGKDLIAMGSSQGGAQTLAAAGLDQQVTFASVSVPAITGVGECLGKVKRNGGWPKPYQWLFFNGKDVKVMADAWDYYDGVFMAKRIKCTVFFTTGLIDTTCPPNCVFAAYNNCPSAKKKIDVFPTMGHSGKIPSAEKELRRIAGK